MAQASKAEAIFPRVTRGVEALRDRFFDHSFGRQSGQSGIETELVKSWVALGSLPIPTLIVVVVTEVVDVEVEVEVEVVVEVKVEVEVEVVEVGVEGSEEPEASSSSLSSLSVQAIAEVRIKARVAIRRAETVISSPLVRIENVSFCAIRLPIYICFYSEN